LISNSAHRERGGPFFIGTQKLLWLGALALLARGKQWRPQSISEPQASAQLEQRDQSFGFQMLLDKSCRIVQSTGLRSDKPYQFRRFHRQGIDDPFAPTSNAEKSSQPLEVRHCLCDQIRRFGYRFAAQRLAPPSNS